MQKKVSSCVPERWVNCFRARGKFEREMELQQRQDKSGGKITEMRDGVLLLKQRGVEGAAGNRLGVLLFFL